MILAGHAALHCPGRGQLGDRRCTPGARRRADPRRAARFCLEPAEHLSSTAAGNRPGGRGVLFHAGYLSLPFLFGAVLQLAYLILYARFFGSHPAAQAHT